MRTPVVALCCLLLAVPLAACHYRPKIVVNVPQGYRGSVIIDCSRFGSDSVEVTADQSGNGTAASCPAKGADVFVIHDGQTTPVNVTNWNQTGDGIVTGFTFSVR